VGSGHRLYGRHRPRVRATVASKSYNLLLISRNPNKLAKVGHEIESIYRSRCRVLALDFSRTDIYDTIEEELKRLEEMDEEIHVLVNNVSICYPKERPQYFTEIPNLSKFIESIINVNINACTRLTALVLPRMVAKAGELSLTCHPCQPSIPHPTGDLLGHQSIHRLLYPIAYTRKIKAKVLSYRV